MKKSLVIVVMLALLSGCAFTGNAFDEGVACAVNPSTGGCPSGSV